MNWLNIELSTLRSPKYLGSDPEQRATWLNLMAYCADQENGGQIRDCTAWPDRMWQQVVGVTLPEVSKESSLWNLCERTGTVTVYFYPTEKEAEVVTKREAGSRGGKVSGSRRRESANEAVCEAELEAKSHSASSSALNGKERNGIGMERNLPPNPPSGEESAAEKADGPVFKMPLDRDLESDFKEFWEAYPENRRKNRYRAESAWSGCRHLLPPQSELLGALEAFKSSSEWRREGGKYIGSVHEWLQERRWQDAPAYSAPPKKAKSVTGKPMPSVDESHAREWLAENYVGSDPSMTFAQWPPFAQTDYLSSLKNQNQIETQAA